MTDGHHRKEMDECNWLIRKKFDFARLIENFTSLFCTSNFHCGPEYREMNINLRRLHRFWKSRKLWQLAAELNVTCWSRAQRLCLLNLKMWHRSTSVEWRNSQMTTGKYFVWTCIYFHVLLMAFSLVSFSVFRTNYADAEHGIKNYRFGLRA